MFFLPLLITLNYYDLLFGLVAKIAPESTPTIRETISFVGTYFVSFSILLYVCIWLCSDVMHLHKAIDVVGGAIFGAATGVICCGVLMMVWFSMPFAERQFPVDDGQMFFPCHQLTLDGATYVARRIEGRRSFSGARFLRDLRFGLPRIPSLGTGYYVASVPNGLKVFIDAGGYSPMSFLNMMKERLAHPETEVPPSEQRRPMGERNRSPIFIQQPGGTEALIGVVFDNVPDELKDLNTQNMFVHDGEIYYAKESISDRALFIKIYRVKREGNLGTLIALFQPGDARISQAIPKLWSAGDSDRALEEILRSKIATNISDAQELLTFSELMVSFMPTQTCYRFDRGQMVGQLMTQGTTNEEARGIVPQLELAGKAYFLGRNKKPAVVEITGDNKWQIFEPSEPNLKEVEKLPGTPRYY